MMILCIVDKLSHCIDIVAQKYSELLLTLWDISCGMDNGIEVPHVCPRFCKIKLYCFKRHFDTAGMDRSNHIESA